MVDVFLTKPAGETAGVDASIRHRAAGGLNLADGYPDYAERLRDACREMSGNVLVSREDALGAAAEIEQLWAALKLLTGWR